MSTQPGRTFVAVVLALVVAIGGSAWISDRSGAKDTVPVSAQSVSTAPQSLAETQPQAPAQPNDSASALQSGYSEGYRSGYQDAQRDCSGSHAVARSRYSHTSTSHATRRVAGARYYNEQHHGHSTRNMILTIAAPAAIGAGIGAIAGGGKGAGAGALIGGGAGALYHLIKHPR